MSVIKNEEKKTCAAYIRVSTHDQEEYSPESQIKLVREYAKSHGMLLPEEFIFRDDGISGRSAEKRPGFQRMISAAKGKPRSFDCILVWKFSRFARNQEESVVYKSLLKRENGIDVISISEPIMEGPFGGLIERIIEWFDAFYSANLGTEVRRGMTERASRGQPVSAAPLGYTYRDKELAIVPDEAETVRMIYQDFLSGVPMIAIAKKLNDMGIRTKRGGEWENRTVRYILTNPVYTGKLRWCPSGKNDYHGSRLLAGTLLVDGSHQPIVSKEVFQSAQEKVAEVLRMYKGASPKAQSQKSAHMLQGLVKCGSCGGTMTYTGKGMNCSNYIHGKCGCSHFISQEKLEALVLEGIRSQLGNLEFQRILRQTPRISGEQEHLRQRVKRQEEVLRRYREAYAAGVDTLEEYRENKRSGEAALRALREALEKAAQAEAADQKGFADSRRKDLEVLSGPSLSPQQKNEILRSFVDHIVFQNKPYSLEIIYRK